MKQETPRSFEQDLYEDCPALAHYETNVLGRKQWVEMLDQRSRAAAGMLMGHPTGQQAGQQEELPPKHLIGYVRRLVDGYGEGDEAKGVKLVFSALIAAGGHRHKPNLAAFLQQQQTPKTPTPAPTPAAPEAQPVS